VIDASNLGPLYFFREVEALKKFGHSHILFIGGHLVELESGSKGQSLLWGEGGKELIILHYIRPDFAESFLVKNRLSINKKLAR
jgi:hypothetical protein